MERDLKIFPKSTIRGQLILIFATVGTCFKPFDRLVKAVDLIARDSRFDVFIQTGHSTYVPQYCRYDKFIDRIRINEIIKDADIIISHAGYGIIGDCIRYNKKIILMPREMKKNEAVDLQTELAEHVSTIYPGIRCVNDVTELKNAIFSLSDDPAPVRHIYCKIPEILFNYINNKPI